MPLLLIAAFAQMIATAPPEAAGRCRDRLAARAGGEIGNFDVRSATRRGYRTILKGTLTAQQRPPKAAPGMMTATHIINASYNFQCSLRRGKVEAASLLKSE